MSSATGRSIGLFGATLVGLGAIVGGGIFALGGVAFAITGPSVILAFAINGVIALLTVLSFAEMATAFPENGGTYSFARKVFQVEAAFLVGWVVWFASIVAAALYALGFASYAIVVLRAVAGGAPAWLAGAGAAKLLGAAATAFYSFRLARKAAGGGRFEMLAKMALFGVLIAAGAAALFGRPAAEVAAGFRPFFTAGSSGLLLATGLTFIALQGFDLIAAAAGEVRDPRRNIPRAMLLSLALALAIYLPLLFLVVAVGTPPGVGVAESASGNPETLIADAARVFLGDAGYWLVVVVALLAMLSALQANLFAASRVARAMALDKTLPAFLASVDARRGTPKRAVAAGALTHWISILARLRTGRRTSGFRSPLFPLVPVAGGLSCLGLAVFQGVQVKTAGILAGLWIGIGVLLYLTIFARRAGVVDASAMATNQELSRLRGRSSLVLVPIANPTSAAGLAELAHALAPPEVGRVLLHSMAVAPEEWDAERPPDSLLAAQSVLGEALARCYAAGLAPEALTTVARDRRRGGAGPARPRTAHPRPGRDPGRFGGACGRDRRRRRRDSPAGGGLRPGGHGPAAQGPKPEGAWRDPPGHRAARGGHPDHDQPARPTRNGARKPARQTVCRAPDRDRLRLLRRQSGWPTEPRLPAAHNALPASQMAKAECPVCELEFPLERNSVVGEILECPDCGAELELTRVDPVRVELAPEVDEDWGE